METVYLKKPSICNEAKNGTLARRNGDVVYQLSGTGALSPEDWGNKCTKFGGTKGMPKTFALMFLFMEMMEDLGIFHYNCFVQSAGCLFSKKKRVVLFLVWRNSGVSHCAEFPVPQINHFGFTSNCSKAALTTHQKVLCNICASFWDGKFGPEADHRISPNKKKAVLSKLNFLSVFLHR